MCYHQIINLRFHQVVASDSMAQILLRCSERDRHRIQSKAHAQKLSMNAYVLRQALDDRRIRDSDAAALAHLYGQLLDLNHNLNQMSESEGQQRAIALCEKVGREIVLSRLSKQGDL
jgi:hypothetical protein